MIHGLTVSPLAPKSFVKMVQNNHEEFWRKHARLPDEWLPFAQGTNHFVSAEEALEYGRVDEVVKR